MRLQKVGEKREKALVASLSQEFARKPVRKKRREGKRRPLAI